MPPRKRKAGLKPRQTSPTPSDIWDTDEILAPNSDTECEPLPKRRKQIEEIARYVRDGGDVYLLSTGLRGPVVQNPWRRKIGPVLVEERVGQVSPAKKRTRKVKGRNTVGNETKVDQYFNSQKNSQEREVVMKKKAASLEKYAVEKEDPIFYDSEVTVMGVPREQMGLGIRCDGYRENSVEPLKAIPRLINFDQIPPSTDTGTQNMPLLHFIAPRRQPTQPAESDHITESASSAGKEIKSAKEETAQENEGLFDAPTPEKTIAAKPMVQEPTARDFESMRNLLGDEPSEDVSPLSKPDDDDLYDPPTPPPNTRPSPIRNSSSDSILPASLTLRPARSSPVKSIPLSVPPNSKTPFFPSKSSNRSPSPRKSPQKSPLRRSSSFHSPSTLRPTPDLQRTQSASATISTRTPPLNTQNIVDLANQSFNAILPTPSPSLLPAAQFVPGNTSKTPKSVLPSGFTPFKVLRSSPVLSGEKSAEGISFKLADSPLTYSPMLEDMLWGDVKFLGKAWDLDEELDKLRAREGQDGQGENGRESQGTSQGCAVEA